jgi:formate dehydrogenase major subunit
MGAIPNKLPGFQDIEQDREARDRLGALWHTTIQPKYGLNLTQMLHAMSRRELTSLFVIGENPAQSDADAYHVEEALAGLDHLVVQEILLTRTAEFAHVVLPAAATWCEGEGTVTNSERRVQRVRKAVEPPAGAKDELWIIAEIAKRLGHDWGTPTAEGVWNEFRVVAPHFAGGMSYARLEALDGIQWPCPDESHPGETFLHGRLWQVPCGGRPAPFSVVHHEPPVEQPDAEFPLLLTTGRRLESYNTGVQSGQYDSPLHNGETLDISPEDAARLGIEDGDAVSISSRRGRVTAPARIDTALRAGMVFMTLHFPDDTATNRLTIDVSDPKSGTAEFKACAVRVERVAALELARKN